MKTTSQITWSVCGLALLALVPALSAQNFGTDIFHLNETVPMTGTVLSNATGIATASEQTQGHANYQSLQIAVSGLDNSQVYLLTALLGDDTNLTSVATVTPDTNGNASLSYQTNSNGKGKGKGHGGVALSAELNPVSNIRGLALLDTNAVVVLSADFSNPNLNSFHYLIKRNLSTNAVNALLQIQADSQMVHYRLTASGLLATTNYLLVLNGDVNQTLATDGKGRLSLNTVSHDVNALLDLHQLALWDSSSNTVFSTQLP